MNKRKSWTPRYIAIICFALLVINSFAQAPDWQWANRAGAAGEDESFSVVTDADGNVFVTGYFISSLMTFGGITLTNAGTDTPDMFIVKYDSSGTVLWAKSAGGVYMEEGRSVATDSEGNVIVAGQFNSPSIVFGTDTLYNASATYGNIFIVKYDPSGNELWAYSADGNNISYGIATDQNDNILVTGSYQGGYLILGTDTLFTSGFPEMFLVKFDPDGVVLWAKSAVGSGFEEGKSVAIDSRGNIIVTGYTGSPVLSFGETDLIITGGLDIFIAKYNTAGELLWAGSDGGSGADYGLSVSTDADGNVLVGGYFRSDTIRFDSANSISNAGLAEIFIVKYDSSGKVLWAKSAGGAADDYGQAVRADAAGNVLLTGYFVTPSITFGTTTLNNAGASDIFLVKFDGSGEVVWAISAGGANEDYGQAVSTDAFGNILLAGYYRSTSVILGTDTLVGHTGVSDVFVGRLGTLPVGIENRENKGDISLFPNPVNGKLSIKGRNINGIEIYNLQGEKMHSISGPANQTIINSQQSIHDIDISDFAKGMYFVKIFEAGKIHTRRIVKQ